MAAPCSNAKFRCDVSVWFPSVPAPDSAIVARTPSTRKRSQQPTPAGRVSRARRPGTGALFHRSPLSAAPRPYPGARQQPIRCPAARSLVGPAVPADGVPPSATGRHSRPYLANRWTICHTATSSSRVGRAIPASIGLVGDTRPHRIGGRCPPYPASAPDSGRGSGYNAAFVVDFRCSALNFASRRRTDEHRTGPHSAW